MKSSFFYSLLILISFAVTFLFWLVGALGSQSSAQANNEYRTCVWLVKSNAITGTVDACKAQRDLMR